MRATNFVSFAVIVPLLIGCATVPRASSPAATAVAATVTPNVLISSPVNGAFVSSGADLPVVVTAADSIGVARIDRVVDGIAVDTYTSPLRPVM
ncbi:MAG: Ig-like domain-containing protein [Candidatus Limnocylindrales bacterium]